MASPELNRDNDHLATGTHESAGFDAKYLRRTGADFASSGIVSGSCVRNITQGTTGLIVSVTENELETTIDWTVGDTYKIYRTGLYNSVISRIWTDVRHGRKATKQSELVDGLFPEDRDLDEEDENVFGPGQPERR